MRLLRCTDFGARRLDGRAFQFSKKDASTKNKDWEDIGTIERKDAQEKWPIFWIGHLAQRCCKD
jgi:hypothetical protein